MSALLLALALVQTPLDEGILVVRRDTLDIARERFRLFAHRGWTLDAATRFDRERPVVALSPILELGPDTQPTALQYDVADPREPIRILGQLGRGRFTVRFLARATERAREFSTGGRTLVLDDSVFAPYLVAAWHARPDPLTVTAIFPRALRRETLTVQDLGAEAGTLRHVTVTGGANQLVHLWLAPDGRLMKVEIPSRRLVAERLP